MEGAQGPNIAQILSAQQHAAHSDENSINFLNNLFPIKFIGTDYIESFGGNLSQLFGSFLNQSMMMGGAATIWSGKEPWKGFLGINLFGSTVTFNLNSGADEIVGHGEETGGDYEPPPPVNDPGMDMMNAGMEYDGHGDINNIQPPMDTPMMDHNPILNRNEVHAGPTA